jgi:hypothetical protein
VSWEIIISLRGLLAARFIARIAKRGESDVLGFKVIE